MDGGTDISDGKPSPTESQWKVLAGKNECTCTTAGRICLGRLAGRGVLEKISFPLEESAIV